MILESLPLKRCVVHCELFITPISSDVPQFICYSILQAAEVISTLQELLDGHEGLTGEAAAKEAVARVGKAQSLIGQFLSASGVEDEKIAAYVAAH